MLLVRRPWLALLVVVAMVGGFLAAVAGSRVVAAPSTIVGLKASTVVHASPLEVWYGQLTPAGVCRLIPACVEGKAVAGGYRFRLSAPTPSGAITETVKATTVRKVRPRLMRLRLSSASSLGRFQGVVDIELTKVARHRTRVGVTVVDATASGMIARVVIPLLKKNLALNLEWTAGQLNTSRKAAGISGRLKVGRSGKHRVRASVKITAAQVSLLVPTARGKVRVVAGNKVLCTAKLSDSKARCRFRAPTKGTRLTAVATGKLSTGFQVWNDTTARWSR